MSRISKKVKKYERWILLGAVILMLATFSVAGQCSPKRHDDPATLFAQLRGSYEARLGRRVEVGGEEFDAVRRRYLPVYDVWGPTLRFARDGRGDADAMSPEAATWAHIAAVGAARDAGYAVSDEELRAGVQRAVELVGRMRSQRFSQELYEQILTYFVRLPATEFEATVREILLKDKYFAPLVDGMRFSKDRSEAFSSWKSGHRRVDLEYAAVPAAQFAERVRLEEETRSTVEVQIRALKDLVSATEQARRIVAAVQVAASKANGALPADTAAFLATDAGRDFAARLKVAPPAPPAPAAPAPVPPVPAGPAPAAPPAPPAPAALVDDVWGHPWTYRVVGDTFTVASAGADGALGTADDVDRGTIAVIDTLVALRRVADGLVAWRATADAWPAKLSDLTTVPPPAKDRKPAPAPMLSVPQDGYQHDLDYDPASGALRSLGADGAKGSADDVVTTVTADRAVVTPPDALSAYAKPAVDAYGGAISVELRTLVPIAFETRSAGPDRTFATADDILTGNAEDLASHYGPRQIDFLIPEKRRFEALYVVPALVPDASFAAAWTRRPAYRDEKRAFDLFRTYVGTDYETTKPGTGDASADPVAIDPADPSEGHGASLIASLREKKVIPADGPVQLVPSAESFGEQKDPPPGESHPDDPLWRTYVEKGWRRVVLRDLFFENLLADVLKRVRASAEDRAKWEKGGRVDAEPPAVTFASELAAWADLQPSKEDAEKGARFLELFTTKPDEPLGLSEWEALPLLGDVNTSEALKPLKDDEYQTIPRLLKGGTIRAAFHSIARIPGRTPSLDEVREKVYPGYLESRTIERAARELEDVSKALKAKDARLDETIAAAAKARDFTYVLGRTGPLLTGPDAERVDRDIVLDASASDAAKAELRLRNQVRRIGYDDALAKDSSLAVGTVGPRILRDETRANDPHAYLVRVAWLEDPSPEEFGTKEYAAWLAKQTSAAASAAPGASPAAKGVVPAQLGRLYFDWPEVKSLFQIQAPATADAPPKREPRRGGRG